MGSMFDQNSWYVVRFATANGNGLQTSGNYFFAEQGPYGSAFLSPYNKSDTSHPFNFQFFPSPQNSSKYILRPQNSQPPVYLAAIQQSTFGNCDDDCSSTGVGVTNLTENNAVWSVIPSGDGQNSFLTNEANGSSWRMAVNTGGKVPGSYLNMANSGGNKSQMIFQFSSAAKINDKAFSTLASGFTSSSAGGDSGPTSTPTPLPEPGSGTPVGAAVGGAVGGFVALVLIVLAILWFLRRRKRSRGEQHEQLPQYEDDRGIPTDKKEGYTDGQAPNEVVEAPEQNAIHEAPRHAEEGMGAEAVNKGHVYELPGEDDGGRGKVVR